MYNVHYEIIDKQELINRGAQGVDWEEVEKVVKAIYNNDYSNPEYFVVLFGNIIVPMNEELCANIGFIDLDKFHKTLLTNS